MGGQDITLFKCFYFTIRNLTYKDFYFYLFCYIFLRTSQFFLISEREDMYFFCEYRNKWINVKFQKRFVIIIKEKEMTE